jgi:prophage regulatory protein
MFTADKKSILRRPQVEARTGQSRSSIYAGMAAGTFPRPVPLGKKAVGWVEAEVTAWIDNCIAQREGGR